MKEELADQNAKQRLGELREGLFALHKALIASERVGYEEAFGAIGAPANFLRLLLNDPWFAWLHSLSELVVRIDETIEPESPATEADGALLVEMGAGTAGQSEAGNETSDRYQMFEPCSKQVKIKMGYLGDLKTMMTGFFTTMEPSFSPSAPATLNVRGINVLQRLRTKKYHDFFEDKKPSEIARLVGERRDEDRNALRLPIQIVTDPDILPNEKRLSQLAQRNEYSIDFLWKLARRVGYVLTMIEPEEEDADPFIRFGPSEMGQSLVDAVYELKLGQSLIDFKPRITTANQFKSVTVNSWNRRTQEMISETVSFEDEEMQELNADLRYMLCMCDAREELVVDEPQWDENQAKERAKALLLDQQKQMVKASGTTVGLPLLKAGTRVRISDVGARLSGDYFVTKTEHIFNDSGYLTKFEARRESVPLPGETRPCRT